MKNLSLLVSILIVFSCNSSSFLDKKFTYKAYENFDYKKLYQSEDLTLEELFLLNYAIVRQREYFNYSIEGKSYREILEMAKGFEKDGLPVTVNMNDNGQQEKIKASTSVEGVGFVRQSKNKKRLYKTFNFSCNFQNTTDKDIVLLNGSFIVKGPFDDHLTTANFEYNCIIPPNKSTDISLSIPGKVIQQNVLYEGNPMILRIGIDSLLNRLDVVPSGISFQESGKYFKDCFFNAARLEPQNIIEYEKAFKETEWRSKNAEGKFELNLGDMHIPNINDDPILMQ